MTGVKPKFLLIAVINILSRRYGAERTVIVMLKGLAKYNQFNWEKFAEGKEFAVTGISEYKDYVSGEHLGTRVDVVIISDKTPYEFKDSEVYTNRFEKLVFKCSKKNLDIPLETRVRPRRVVASIYGEYRNMLSIKCEDVEILSDSAANKVRTNV